MRRVFYSSHTRLMFTNHSSLLFTNDHPIIYQRLQPIVYQRLRPIVYQRPAYCLPTTPADCLPYVNMAYCLQAGTYLTTHHAVDLRSFGMALSFPLSSNSFSNLSQDLISLIREILAFA